MKTTCKNVLANSKARLLKKYNFVPRKEASPLVW